MNKLIPILIGLVVIGAGGYWYWQKSQAGTVPTPPQQVQTEQPGDVQAGENQEPADTTKTVLGTSVEGREIVAHHYGEGEREVVFVGGMHGGYSSNTSLVAYELMQYLENNPSVIPANISVTVIPVLNPDGLVKVTGKIEGFTSADITAPDATRIAGRFNANTVDLNRNFDCDWKASGTWQNRAVSGGSAAFSEPESQAFKSYVEKNKPAAVVVWYSAAGGVFPSLCGGNPSAETRALTNAFANASGYKAFSDFDFYEVTGDMPNWLSKIGIPAISVLLTDHENTEWSKNQKGIEAVISHIAR